MADTIAFPLLLCVCNRLSFERGSSGFRIWEKNLSYLWRIKAIVLEEEQVPEREMEVKKWLKEVSDVAYQADDLLDEIEFYIHKIGNNFSFLPIPSCFRVVLSLFPYQTTSLLLLNLRRTEASLVQLVHKYNIICRGPIHLKAETEGVGSVIRHLGTVSSINRNDYVVGRNEEKETIVGWLLENTYKYPFSVVEIVGMGGIGKTTLAQLVYIDDAVHRHFEFMAWVCVSQEFDAMRIAREILEAATIGSYSESLEVLGKELIRVLRSKRFLIVLDDVWAEIDDKNWSILKNWFIFGSWGSKVLLTTRRSKVAAFTIEHRSYFLRHLSHKDCWSLFQRHAYLERYEDEEGNDKIFKEIVAKCKGLPLAVKTLARLMRLKQTVQECLSMAEIDIFQLEEFKLSVLGSLGMSYNHLPPHLKPCFAFCSIFPKGCSITKEKLIQFWISNRLIGKPTSTRGVPLEKIGSDYFEELVERSFFMDVSRDEYGDMSTKCQMHDLIHELALSVAGNWCSVVETGTLHADISDELHHSSLISTSGEPSILQTLHQAKNLRTLLLFSSGKLDKIPTSIFQVLRCLRVLDLSQTGLCDLPVSVGHLIHLRYLDLSHTYIKVLPRSIAKLKYLQSLRLVGCSHLPELPKAISKLLNLRNLDIRSCCLLSHMPCGIGKLRLLQTLPLFLLSETGSCGNLQDLGGLNLRGRLEIKNLENVRNLVEADDAKLQEMVNICSLGLSWGAESTMGDLVIEKLRPSQNVEVLDIIGYRGFFPPWLYDKDSSLVKLSLIDCYCDALPPLGQLPHLRHLHVKGLSQVQFIGSEFYGNASDWSFKSLKQLELYDMPNLVKWENSEPEVAFPLLETLSIKGCLKLAGLPLLPKVRKIALSTCSMMLLESLANLASLGSLVINDFRDHSILSLKLGSLNSIRTLTIYNCDSLIYLLVNGIRKFNSLENLSILHCRKLEIIGCLDLVGIPSVEPSLYYLRELTIVDCPSLFVLPEDGLKDLIYIDWWL